MLYSVNGVYYQGGLSMLEQWILGLDIVSQSGFLGTKATFMVDATVSFLVTLPIVIMISIFFAKRDYIKIHQFLQVFLLLATISALAMFAYSVHYIDGFESLIQKSSVSAKEAYIILTLHVTTVVITILIWFLTIVHALNDKKRRALPGVYSEPHRRAGRRVLLGIVMMVITSLSIYVVLYIA